MKHEWMDELSQPPNDGNPAASTCSICGHVGVIFKGGAVHAEPFVEDKPCRAFLQFRLMCPQCGAEAMFEEVIFMAPLREPLVEQKLAVMDAERLLRKGERR